MALYANRESVRGYAEAYRNGERVSTAHVESTVNLLINWRMCKIHQMGWSRAGAQCRFQLKRRLSHFQRYFFQLNRDWSRFFQLNRRLRVTAKAVVRVS